MSSSTPCLEGVHGRADGRMQVDDFKAVQVARLKAVKLLSTASPDDVTALWARDANIFIVVRLFADLRSRRASPADFVSWVEGDLVAFYQRGVRYFEIHNEPNLRDEGWQLSWADGREFGRWFADVCARLRARWPGLKLGWPGLSPGGGLTVRRPEALFLDEAGTAVNAADWIGVHCYWQDAAEMKAESGGRSYAAYQRRYPTKPLIIAEFSNQNPSVRAEARGQQYVEYYRALRAEPNLLAAFAFVVSASNPAFGPEAWRREDGSLTAIPAIVGARPADSVAKPVTPPAPASPPAMPTPVSGQYQVTAAGLNIRRSPWVTSVEPAVVGYLNHDELVVIVKQQQGWGSLDAAGTRWVNMRYLAPYAGPVITPTPEPAPPVVTPPPSTLRCPVGKGILIWQIAETAGGDAQVAAKMAVDAGYAWVSLKIADGSGKYPYTLIEQQQLLAMVQAFHAAGLKVHGWHYVRGDNPVGEADIALKRIKELKLDGYQIDAESEYKNRGKATAAATYMKRLRAGTDVPLGLCAYRFPLSHPELPWAEFLANCDYHAPQVYPMGQSSATAFGVQLRESVRQLTEGRLLKTQPLNALWKVLPIVPIGPAYRDKYTPLGGTEPIWWEPTTAQLNDFHATARDLKLPGEGWYSWQAAAGRSWWSTLAAQTV